MKLKNGKIAEYITWGNFTKEEVLKKATHGYNSEVSKIVGIF
jgi:hypothetical protein